MLETNFSTQALMTPTAALAGKLVPPVAEGVDEAHTAAAVQERERLTFRVGPFGILVPPEAGREVVLPPSVSRLPHLPTWLLGIANVRGTLVPVVDTARAFEVEHDAAARRYLLIFNHGHDVFGLLVDGLPRRQSFAAHERLRNLPPHPPLLKGHLADTYDRAGLLWFELDLNGFFSTLGARLGQA